MLLTKRIVLVGALCLWPSLALGAQSPGPADEETPKKEVPDTMPPEAAQLSVDDAVAWFEGYQNEDGSWASPTMESILELGFSIETYYAWQLAAQGLGIQAMMAVEETPERRAVLDKAVDWFLTTRLPKRGDGWDTDYVWTMLCDMVALVDIQDDPRFQEPEMQARIAKRGKDFIDLLERNQAYHGGWAYYDNPPFTKRPKWGTSFCTALVLPAYKKAIDLGWSADEDAIAAYDRALKYVQRCALPNEAYEYSLSSVPRVAGESISNVKGSLGRIQVCNWARRVCGDERITDDVLRRGLEAFFREHKFLDAAFMRPVPHEAYYANAAYFYHFGHYYAAMAIELLPEPEREAWHAKLRPHLVKTQRADGSLTDFLGTGYLRVASTAYTILALQSGLE
ncbi:MAG: hypothetical protein ACI9D0_000210 [Bacteroidia bacterium]|jgi:hypothetical protein